MDRRIPRTVLVVTTLLSTLTACAQEVPVQDGFDTADEAAIRANLSTYMASNPNTEPDAFFSQFTDDVHWIYNGQDPWVGMEGLRAVAWCNTVEAEITADRVEGSADLAYARGTYSIDLDCEGGPDGSAGSFLSVHRRGADGGWRIEAMHQLGSGSG